MMQRCGRVSHSVVFFASDVQQQIRMRFKIKQKLDYGRRLAVVGSNEELGMWNVSNTTATLEWHDGNIWTGEAVMKPGPVEFKLVVVSDEDVVWPDGDNVSLLIPESAGFVDVTGGEEGGLNLTILEDASPSVSYDGTQSVVEEEACSAGEELSLRFLQSLKVAELKAMCKERGLAVSGKKSDLIDRLTNVESL